MFGWLKKRERFESIKLVTQNKLAAAYLRDFFSTAAATGGRTDAQLLSTLDVMLDEVVEATFRLRSGPLDPQLFDSQFKINKELRRFYDEILAGRRAFAQNFGAASEKLESFDRKFEPNEGWKIFVEHFR